MVAQVHSSETEFNQRLATLLIELRGNCSLREFAQQIGVSHNDVRRWESGKGEPRLRVLGKIADLKGWTLDELKIYLEGALPSRELNVQKVMADVRSLPLEAVAQVAAVAVETLAAKSIASQTSMKSVYGAVDPESALSA